MNSTIANVNTQTPYLWPPSKRELYKLYWDMGLSTHKIAKIFKKTHEGIRYRMDKYQIPRRNTVDAAISANTRHVKFPFDEDLATRAYLLGFRTGDLTAYWYRRCIEVSTSTTHPAMVELFKNVFSRYGKVNVGPRYKRKHDSYFWALSVRLDSSFQFLIEKSRRIPSWIASNPTFFLHFLAGYFDAEGTIYCYKHGNRADFYIQIASTDSSLLEDIKNMAGTLGYDFRLTLSLPKGLGHGYGNSNKDYWALRLYRDDSIIPLIKKLPLMHREKLAIRELILSVHNRKWCEVGHFVKSLRAKIKEETLNFVSMAEKEFNQKHICTH